jgi:phosphoenolpyruvate carboxykinase (GTP)
MTAETLKTLQSSMNPASFEKLTALKNDRLCEFIADAVALCGPRDVFVCTDSPDDLRHVRRQAVAGGEEKPLAIEGHTVHFDGMQDQGRDREVTRYLVPSSDALSAAMNQVEREDGLAEVRGLL